MDLSCRLGFLLSPNPRAASVSPHSLSSSRFCWALKSHSASQGHPKGETRFAIVCTAALRRFRSAIGACFVAAALFNVFDFPSFGYGLIQGRLAPCKGDTSCVSTTSVANPSKFGPPWTFEPQTSNPSEAWESLKEAIIKSSDKGVIVESTDGPKLYYLRAEYPSPSFGGILNTGNIDDVEFRMIPEERLMTYRSASRQVFYLYPLQRPIDVGKNRARLESIRQQLGWVELEGQNLY